MHGLIKKMLKNQDMQSEIIHGVIERNNINKIYSKRKFSKLMLTLFYLRLVDFEDLTEME